MKSSATLFLLFALLICSCKQPDHNKVTTIDFEATTGELFTPDRFKKAGYTPFQTIEKSIIESNAKLIATQTEYFIFNRTQMEVLCFDQSGKFLHKISAKGNGPGEYTSIQDFLVNPAEKSIEVLSMQMQKVLKYSYNGNYLSKTAIPGHPFSFAKLKNGDYIFGKGAFPDNDLGTHQLYQTAPDGTLRFTHLAVVNNGLTMPFFEENIQNSNGNIYFKSWLNGNIYQVADTSCILATLVDFKDKKLNEHVLENTPDAFFDLIMNTPFYSIDRYLENDDYIYLFTTSGDGKDMRHVLYEKNSEKSFTAGFSADTKTIPHLNAAQALTPDNELIFIAEPFVLNKLIAAKPELFPAIQTPATLDDYSNSVLIKLKIK